MPGFWDICQTILFVIYRHYEGPKKSLELSYNVRGICYMFILGVLRTLITMPPILGGHYEVVLFSLVVYIHTHPIGITKTCYFSLVFDMF